MELSMSNHPVGAWLFGKAPAHGDFIARGLDGSLRDALDAWLSREMADARTVHDDDFDARFDQAPLVKFIDRDAEGRLAGGSLCASVDAVGRRFPLMAAIPADDLAGALAASDSCEAAIHAAFAERLDADAIHRRLSSSAGGVSTDGAGASRWWIDAIEPGEQIWERPGRFPTGIVTQMLSIAQ